jgi:hypothetical protein
MEIPSPEIGDARIVLGSDFAELQVCVSVGYASQKWVAVRGVEIDKDFIPEPFGARVAVRVRELHVLHETSRVEPSELVWNSPDAYDIKIGQDQATL